MTAKSDPGAPLSAAASALSGVLRRAKGDGVASDELEVGSISGVFGVQGEVRLYLHHRDTTLFASWRDVVLLTPAGERFVGRLRARSGAGRRVLGRIHGVEAREQAEALKDLKILVPASSLPAPASDEFYVWQIEGADVFEGEERIGRLVTVHDTAGGDVLEIRVARAREPVFLPCTKAFVLAVDAAARVVRLQPGALAAADLDASE